MTERAKISVSLPDDLKARLDAYAEEHQQSVSQVVQDALQRFLDNPPTPPPLPPESGHLEHDVQQLQRYVTALAANHEQVRASLQLISEMSATQGVFIPCPAPVGAPPWAVKT